MTLEREGRSYSAASIRLEQGGAPMTLGLATLGELPEDGAAWDAAPAPAPTPLAETQPIPVDQSEFPAFMRNYDMRWAHLRRREIRACEDRTAKPMSRRDRADGSGRASRGAWTLRSSRR